VRSAQETLDTLTTLSSQQVWLRGSIVLATVVFVAATAAAGDVSPILVALIVLLTVACAITPDSHTGTFLIGALAWQWLAGVDDVASPWTMLGAAAVLALHVAIAACTIAPPSAELSTMTVVRWSRRTAIVATGIVAVWAITAALVAVDTPGNVGVAAGGALALLGLLALAWPRADAPGRDVREGAMRR